MSIVKVTNAKCRVVMATKVIVWRIICNKITYCKELRLLVSLLLCLVQLAECSMQPEGTTCVESGEQLCL